MLSNRLTLYTKVPVPVLVLVASAIAVNAVPSLHAPATLAVADIVTVALVCILLAGGMDIGAAASGGQRC